MALRCFLISLVACFGLEIPTPSDVASWSEPGRNWMAARGGEIASLRTRATKWLLTHSPASRPEGELSSASGSESASIPALAPKAEDAPRAAEVIADGSGGTALGETDEAFERITAAIADEFAADDLAYAMPDGPPAPEAGEDASVSRGAPGEANRLLLVQEMPAPIAPPSAAVAEAASSPPGVTTDRLNSAVRLTHEAVRAWADLARAVGADEHRLR